MATLARMPALPRCAEEISESATICLFCGAGKGLRRIDGTWKVELWMVVAAAVALLLAAIIVALLAGSLEYSW